ncbi:MAG TPA: PAS domain S-box protein, partial [Polyangiaceae bacterium]|nr:PAS domain S-box protein [Polyangiaceae bacterium]
NPVTCRIFGRSRDELVGQMLWSVFPEAHGNPFHRAFEHVAQTGETAHVEHYYTPWERWFDNHIYLAGERIWVIARDITDEKQAALRLDVLANASRVFAGAAADGRRGFEAIARHVAELIGDMCSIRLLSADAETFEAPIGIWDVAPAYRELLANNPSIAASEAIGPEILASGKAFVMSSIDPRAIAAQIAPSPRRTLVEQLGIHSVMVVPLKAEGRVLGILSVCRRQTGTRTAYADADRTLLEELSDRAALVVNQWRTLERVEDARQQLATITDALPVLVSLVDDQLHYRFVNAMYERWFGQTRDQLIGRPVQQVLGAEAFLAVEAKLRAALDGELVSFEASVPYAVAGTRHIRSTNTPYRVDGRVRGYIALVQDISVEKAHEAQLQRWEQLFQHAGWGVAMIEPGTHRLLAVNPAFARMHGYNVDELLGRPLSECLAPESRLELDGHAATARSDGHHQYEAIHLRKDGSRFPCLTESSEFRDDSGTVIYQAANFQDITERKRYEAELRAAIATRDEFLSIASHELRTPLTALSLQLDGLARVLERSAASPERDRTARKIGMAVRQADRLASLIDGLLNVSRIATGSFRLEPEPFDMVGLVHEVVQRFDEEAERMGASVSVTVPEAVLGRWDRSRVDQALTNLLSNALKYGAGSPIDIVLMDFGERVSISVRDQGIGIALEDRERVLGRFERAVSSSHYGGLGLGLYIANEIARAHGGAIVIDSLPGKGATFTLTLPRPTFAGEVS